MDSGISFSVRVQYIRWHNTRITASLYLAIKIWPYVADGNTGDFLRHVNACSRVLSATVLNYFYGSCRVSINYWVIS